MLFIGRQPLKFHKKMLSVETESIFTILEYSQKRSWRAFKASAGSMFFSSIKAAISWILL